MQPIDICYFCSLTSMDTGMPISTFRLVEHFTRREGYTVRLVVPDRGLLTRKAAGCGAMVYVFPFVRLRSLTRLFGIALSMASAAVASVRLWRVLRKHDVRIVHYSDVIDLLFYPAARCAGCRVVAHLRVSIENAGFRILYRMWTGLFVDRVVCISHAVKRFAGIRGPKAVVVYNPGPDPRLFNPSQPASALPRDVGNDRVRILAVGKFVEVKGHDLFVDMARHVETIAAGRARYLILGGRVDGHEHYYERVMKSIRESGLEATLEIMAPMAHEEIPRLLASIDLFVHLPRWQEGLGGAVLEALAMGTPVVAFDSGAMSECITDGVSGYIVAHMDTAAAARRVAELVKDDTLRGRMGQAARREVAARFSEEKHFSAIDALYAGLAGAG